jgi:putative ABC transport system permease protein
MRDALAAIPGVESVTAASEMPLNGEFFPYRWGKEEALADSTKFLAADAQIVIPGYFEAMHVPLIAGRTFNDSDNTADARHIVVDQFLAAKAFPGQNAIGQRILMRFRTPQPEWFEIVGVAVHQRLTALADPGREQAWITDGYFGYRAVPEWAVRVRGDTGAFADRIRSIMRTFDPAMRVTKMQSMDAILEGAQAGTRFSLLLISTFAAIAATLAGVGLYGVLSTVVRQRTAEIGLRMALGAAPKGIFGLVIGHGLRLSAAGVGLGLLSALLLTRVMTSMLVGIRQSDPVTYGAMIGVFLLIATLSTWLPARRAAALDPAVALREE